MIIKHPDQRVAVLIDSQNFYHTAKNLFNAHVNFKNILEDLIDGRRLVRAIAYVVTSDQEDEEGFFDALAKIGIETRTKDLITYADGSKKADWDVGLAVDAIKIASKVDAVIILSGDGDFVPLVEYLKMSVQVEVSAFGRSTSGKLREVVDSFTDLEEKKSRYLIFSKKRTYYPRKKK